MKTWDYPLDQLFAEFPHLPEVITPGQIGKILATVTEADREAWALTVQKYGENYNPRLNQYVPSKVGNLLDTFRSIKARAVKMNNSARVGANDDYVELKSDCKECWGSLIITEVIPNSGLQTRELPCPNCVKEEDKQNA